MLVFLGPWNFGNVLALATKTEPVFTSNRRNYVVEQVHPCPPCKIHQVTIYNEVLIMYHRHFINFCYMVLNYVSDYFPSMVDKERQPNLQ